MWNVGERRWWDLDTTLWLRRDWLHYLGCSHFNLRKPQGLRWLWWKGVVGEGHFLCLVCIISPRTKLAAWIFHFRIKLASRKYTLSCKYRACVAGWVHASYRESGNLYVSSPRGLWGDGPSSRRCPTGSWFLVQSLCACCSDTSNTQEEIWHHQHGTLVQTPCHSTGSFQGFVKIRCAAFGTM